MDRMINAQKFAKMAVSALQFFDEENAKKNLELAMKALQ